jgi:hypothetical protein
MFEQIENLSQKAVEARQMVDRALAPLQELRTGGIGESDAITS